MKSIKTIIFTLLSTMSIVTCTSAVSAHTIHHHSKHAKHQKLKKHIHTHTAHHKKLRQASSAKHTPHKRLRFIVTAYSQQNGKGITASGRRVAVGRTIAAPRNIPFGTRVYIPSLHHTYVVEDRGGAIKGNKLDLLVATNAKAIQFGRRTLDIELL